jgi:hypothetical protein
VEWEEDYEWETEDILQARKGDLGEDRVAKTNH